MIVGTKPCNWTLGWRNRLILGKDSDKVQRSLYFPKDTMLTTVPVIETSIRLTKKGVVWSQGHMVLTMRWGGALSKALLRCLQDEGEVFKVRNGKIHGRWSFTIAKDIFQIIPVKSSVQYTECEPYRDSLIQWYKDNYNAEER